MITGALSKMIKWFIYYPRLDLIWKIHKNIGNSQPDYYGCNYNMDLVLNEYEIFFKNILLNRNKSLPLQSQILRERRYL